MKSLLLFALLGAMATGQEKVLICNKLDGCPVPVTREPMDVEAIHVPAKSRLVYESSCNEDTNICSGELVSCSNHGSFVPQEVGHFMVGTPQCEKGWRWGCADSARILLTDEGGGKHCVKLPKD